MSPVNAPGHRIGWMLFKRRHKAYHPYLYNCPRNAAKQVGWFGDEVHRVEIRRIKELPLAKKLIGAVVNHNVHNPTWHRWYRAFYEKYPRP